MISNEKAGHRRHSPLQLVTRRRIRFLLLPLLTIACLFSLSAHGANGAGGQTDAFIHVLLVIAVMIFCAMVGRSLAGHFGQPSVVGELLIGVIIGNVGYLSGIPAFVAIMHFNEVGSIIGEVLVNEASLRSAVDVLNQSQMASGKLTSFMFGDDSTQIYVYLGTLWVFSNLGIIFLMFMAGLESSIEKMRLVGRAAATVGVAGVILPLMLSYVATRLLLPEGSVALHLFFGATLAATSVGISTVVFEELGLLDSRAASIVLGAAVFDDILALIVLSTVMGIAVSGFVDVFEIAKIIFLSATFLGLIVFAGRRIVMVGIPLFEHLDRFHVKLLYAVFFMCVIAVLANLLGLATIIGAFAAGLLLSDKYFHVGESRSIKELVAPLEILLAPIFFVLIGMQVNVLSLISPNTVILALALLAVAVVGKLASGFVVKSEPDKLTIGFGMVPRGEVGLILAGVGHTAGILNNEHFAAVVSVIFVTTIVAPMALKWSLLRDQGRS